MKNSGAVVLNEIDEVVSKAATGAAALPLLPRKKTLPDQGK